MILSTKLSIDDYNAFLILTKLEYQAGLIKEESTSELLRFTIRHILPNLKWSNRSLSRTRTTATTKESSKQSAVS